MRNRLPFVFILITLLLDAMGIGLILPVMPDLLREVTGEDLSRAALWGGVLTTVFAVMQFLCGPALGGLSDRFGRRPVLLVSLAIMAADYVVMALAGSIGLLLVARVVGGITAASHATAAACIADLSAPEKKAANFGLIGAAFGGGFILGPVIGGVLAEFGTRAPFWAAAVLAGANLVFGWLVLPETLKPENRRPFQWARANPFGALRAVGRLPGLKPPLLVYALYKFAQVAYPAVWAYFGATRFGWSPGMIGLSLAIFGISFAVMQGGLIRWILPRLGDWGTVAFGLTANLCIFLTLAFIEDGRLALVLTPLTALGACVVPPLQAMMSRATPPDAQGELQGLLQSLRSLAMVAGPVTFTAVFFAFTAPGGYPFMPGAPFLFSAAIMAVCGVVLAALRRA